MAIVTLAPMQKALPTAIVPTAPAMGTSVLNAARMRAGVPPIMSEEPTPTQLPFTPTLAPTPVVSPMPSYLYAGSAANGLPSINDLADAAQAAPGVQKTLQGAAQGRIGGPDAAAIQAYARSVATSGMTPQKFAIDILRGLGDKVNAGNEEAMEAWEAQEGGNWKNTATANPLNTTYSHEPGYEGTGTQGDIGAYPTWEQGIDATLKTLASGDYNQLRQALSGNSYGAIINAIRNSPWGTKF